MNINWLQIIVTIAWIICGFLAVYFREKTNIVSQIAGKIAEAEDIYKDYTKAGSEKFGWVCDFLEGIVPVFLKPFITRAFIENAVQKVFNQIEVYATQQLDKVFNKDK